MNKDILEGKWKEMHGQFKEWWGKLTDDRLEQAGGNAEQIVGLLQQKYGYTHERLPRRNSIGGSTMLRRKLKSLRLP